MIHIKNKKTYKQKDEDIYIGRGGDFALFGNPFKMKNLDDDKEREEVCKKYLEYAREQYKENKAFELELDRLAYLHYAGHDITLVCWCAPKKCHGEILRDIIKKIAKQIDLDWMQKKGYLHDRRFEDIDMKLKMAKEA